MMAIFMKVTCSPALKKIEGGPDIQLFTPTVDAQFLIGKSWDASLRLLCPDVFEKHCTIEKVAADKWTIVSHENAVTFVNNVKLPYGLPKFLRFGDKLRITSTILFQFICVCMDCVNCGNFSEAPSQNVNKLMTNQFDFVRDVQYDQNDQNQICFFVPGQTSWHTGFDYMCGESSSNFRNENVEDLTMYWENKKNETDECFIQTTKSYGVDKCTGQQKLKESKQSYVDLKILNETISNQSLTIQGLRMQLHNMENHKISLEGRFQHSSSENVALHSKISEFVEYSQKLDRQNNDLQLEVVELKKKLKQLEKEVDKLNTKPKDTLKSVGSQTDFENLLIEEMQIKLTGHLEAEFKCSICDEVCVEAVITNCAHMFCYYCIKSWKFIKPNCPICRTILTKEVKVLSIDSYLSNAMPMATDNVRDNWLKLVEERKNLKEKLQTKEEPSSLNEYRSSNWHQNNSNPNDFHDALMNVYQQLLHYEENVIDLTNERTYML